MSEENTVLSVHIFRATRKISDPPVLAPDPFTSSITKSRSNQQKQFRIDYHFPQSGATMSLLKITRRHHVKLNWSTSTETLCLSFQTKKLMKDSSSVSVDLPLPLLQLLMVLSAISAQLSDPRVVLSLL